MFNAFLPLPAHRAFVVSDGIGVGVGVSDCRTFVNICRAAPANCEDCKQPQLMALKLMPLRSTDATIRHAVPRRADAL